MGKLLAGGLVLAIYFAMGCMIGAATLALGAGPADSCFPLGAGSCVRVPIPIVATASQLPTGCTKGEIIAVTGTGTGNGCVVATANQLCLCTAPGTATAWSVVP